MYLLGVTKCSQPVTCDFSANQNYAVGFWKVLHSFLQLDIVGLIERFLPLTEILSN